MNDVVLDNKEKKAIKGSFHKLFEFSHIFYTILFFIIIIVITILSLFPRENVGNFVLFATITFSLTYLILMFIGMIPQLDSHLFSRERKDLIKKFTIFIVTFGICFLFVLLYFIYGSSSQIAIEFLGWDIVLPYLCVIIYFGWNLVQIFFLRNIFENISENIDDKLITNARNSSKNKIISIIILIFGLVVPFAMQLGSYFGLLPYFEPQSSAEPVEPFYWFNGWNISMVIIIILLSYRLIFLFLKSRKNETPNVYSSMFYIFIWLYLWYRSFSFIWSFRRITHVHGFDFFRIFMDILLMILTSIMVLKSLGDKLIRFKIFTANNLLLFLFAFTILYFEGQIVMILGAGSIAGTYTTQSQINLVNNFLIILISIAFYWWYSEFTLERKNLIFKKNFKQKEVISLIKEFKEYLESTGALELDKISDYEFQNFLKTRKLKLENLKDNNEFK